MLAGTYHLWLENANESENQHHDALQTMVTPSATFTVSLGGTGDGRWALIKPDNLP